MERDVFQSCKRGDIINVKFLVEKAEINLNLRDRWDSTPLYYACLCGHSELVKYLLENGAKCEANTFDSERCLYSALNSEIKNILKSYKVVSKTCFRRDAYEEFLRRLLETGDYSDIQFNIRETCFNAHKCILWARSVFFSELFQNKWNDRKFIQINNQLVKPAAFFSILQYLYTGTLQTHIEEVEYCILLAEYCQLFQLKNQLEKLVKRTHSFECNKPGTNVKNLLLEPTNASVEIAQDFGLLLQQALPLELSHWIGGSILPTLPQVPQNFIDIIFIVEDYTFYCHKAFMCGRSEYFRTLINYHTISDSHDTMSITLNDLSAEVFKNILHYIYQNAAPLTEKNVIDVLLAADMFLLPVLKKQCAIFLSSVLSIQNVINVLQISRFFELLYLEDSCTEFIAKHLEQLVDDQEFQKIIKRDAEEICNREEIDSINIIDNIRYHINVSIQTVSDMQEAEEKHRIINILLEKLNLDA